MGTVSRRALDHLTEALALTQCECQRVTQCDDGRMDRDELLEVLSPAGLRLLDALPPYESQTDVVRLVGDLRKAGHAAGTVAAVLSQAKLRRKAAAKFGPFAERMLFTEAGLEQATRLRVAALHAGRFRDAGVSSVADLGCGIGADALALASLDLEVHAVERDEVTAAIAAYNLAPWANATVTQGDALAHPLSPGQGVYLDPARRTAGTRNTARVADPADWSPSLDDAFAFGAERPTGVKLGPGVDRGLLPEDAEWQWISVDGEVVEAGVWFGPLARDGVRRSALVLRDGAGAELTGSGDAEDEPVVGLGRYLYEPDGAVIRARLIGDLARSLGAGMLADRIAYLSADELRPTPFAQAFEVLEEVPFQEKAIAKALSARGIGRLEIKKRGADVDPARLRASLRPKGPEEGTLVVTRIGERHRALIARRVPSA